MTSGGWKGSHSSGFPTPTRKQILRLHPVCQCTGCRHHDGPCTKPSTIADHITAAAFGGSNELSNGQGLCDACHQIKTQHEAMTTRAVRSRKRPTEPHPGLRMHR